MTRRGGITAAFRHVLGSQKPKPNPWPLCPTHPTRKRFPLDELCVICRCCDGCCNKCDNCGACPMACPGHQEGR